MRQIIKLKESELRNMIYESVKKVLNEEYRDLGNTSGLKSYYLVFELYNKIKNLINSNEDDWKFLHSEDDWYNFFNKLKDVPEQMKFYTSYKGNPDKDVNDALENFAKNCRNIPYPDLSTVSSSSFVEKTKSIKNCLKYAYKLYDNFINYLVSRHENDDTKQEDMKSDWSNFEKNKQDVVNKAKAKAESDYIIRKYSDSWGRSHKRGALDRYDLVANPEKEGNKEFHNWLVNNKGGI